MMRRGYGRQVLGLLRGVERTCAGGGLVGSYPRVLGRDFCGEVMAVGRHVSRVQPGDHVWGAIYPSQDGSHQQVCVAQDHCVGQAPSTVTDVQAASIPYAGLTAWSAIKCASICRGSRVLVIGGAGGVGQIATQILAKYLRCHVTVFASSRDHPMMSNLGAQTVIDNRENSEAVRELDKVDAVIDCAGIGVENIGSHLNLGDILSPGGRFVSLSSPVLNNTDKLGILPGTLSSISTLMQENMKTRNYSTRWAFFQPDIQALDLMRRLVDEKVLTVSVSKVFSFDKLPDAYDEADGPVGGKFVIDVSQNKV